MKRLIVATAVLVLGGSAAAQTDTTFTYQGHLAEGAVPANGLHNIDVGLWDAASGGSQIGSTQSFPAHPVGEGGFTLELDFGADAFDNAGRWLEITVNTVTLSPRQPVTRSPYAIQTRGIFVDGAKNVGIGTNAPAEELHVRGNSPTLQIQDDDDPDSYTSLEDASQSYLRFTKKNQSGPILFDISLDVANGTDGARFRVFRGTNTTGSKSVDFLRGNNSTNVSASIDVDGRDSWFGLHGGRLGIGTWQPSSTLSVNGDFDVQGDALHANIRGVGVGTTELLGNFMAPGQPGGTAGAGLVVKSDEFFPLYVKSDVLASGGLSPGGGAFWVDNLGTAWMRALRVGNWSIGHYPTHDNDLNFSYGTTGDVCRIDRVTGRYILLSDASEKKNIEPMGGVLSRITQLNPVRYHYDRQGDDEPKGFGFITQDVRTQFPDLVEDFGDGKIGLAYSQFGPLAIKAVQEQQQIIQTQRAIIEKQQTELADHESRLERLEQLVTQLSSLTENEQ